MDVLGELLIEIYPERIPNPGGQHVGFTSTGVKVTHIPSGIIAICEAHRSQHKNRTVACDMIMAALTHPTFAVRSA
jgi:protein subunit release factor A